MIFCCHLSRQHTDDVDIISSHLINCCSALTHNKVNNDGVERVHRPEGLFIYLVLNMPDGLALRVLSCEAQSLLLPIAVCLPINGLFRSATAREAELIVWILIPIFTTRIV